MSGILILHLVALGIWIGVVGAEFFIEFDGMKDDESYIRAAKMHFATDMWVEIPAFMTVLVTGAFLLAGHSLEGVFLFKVVFGVLAVVFNLVCVYAVVRRRRLALAGDIEGMRATEGAMKLGGAGFIPCFLMAIALAAYSVIL